MGRTGGGPEVGSELQDNGGKESKGDASKPARSSHLPKQSCLVEEGVLSETEGGATKLEGPPCSTEQCCLVEEASSTWMSADT